MHRKLFVGLLRLLKRHRIFANNSINVPERIFGQDFCKCCNILFKLIQTGRAGILTSVLLKGG